LYIVSKQTGRNIKNVFKPTYQIQVVGHQNMV